MILKLIILILSIYALINLTNGQIVKVKQGLVSGKKEILENGKVMYEFSHIPYAQSPVGKRRFKEPEPVKPWLDVWNATTENGVILECMQWLHNPGSPSKIIGQEDCLYLSVFTPQIPKKGDTILLDVIVFIHGGAFMFGSGQKYRPHYLIERYDVVYVNLNYRLGPLGFLSTGDNEVPGNMGLKDQTEALRWVKENIAQFGGNPKSITISGNSAGGASVHFHMLSPYSKGLFQKAISESGTALCPWPIAEHIPEKSKTIATYVGCSTSDSKKMVECLKSRSAPMIVEAVKLFQPFVYAPFSPFGPIVDSFAKNPFLPDYPSELLKQGKVADVPWLESVTTAEGLYPAAEYLVSEDLLKQLDAEWIKLAPHILDYNFTVEDEQVKDEIAEKIRKKYLGDKPITKENHEAFVKILSDRLFTVDAERAARFQAAVNKAPVYVYDFNYRGTFSLSNHYGKSMENFGVSHADDSQYVLKIGVFGKPTTVTDLKMVDFFTHMWTSFAKNGKPDIPSWLPVTKDSFNYLRIESPDDYQFVENAPEFGSRSFWDSLPFDEKNLWKPASERDEL